MIITLLFLTVSAPLSFNSQPDNNVQSTNQSDEPMSQSEGQSSAPLGNSTEEKVPSSNNIVEEYLHDPSDGVSLSNNNINKFGTHDSKIFIDYHHELLVPPPNQA